MTDRGPLEWNGSVLLVLAAFVLAALNLRPAIASVPPVLELIRADLGLSYTAVSLLTTIPMFCMGLFAFLTPRVARFGRERGLFWAIVLVGLATAARVASHHLVVLFATTIIVGIAIAVGQTLLPALVGEYFPERPSFATGIYSISLAVGAILAAALTVPIYQTTSSWAIGLASWASLGIVAAVVLVPLVREREKSPVETETVRRRLPWRNPLAWTVTLFFAGTSTIFYSGLTWLAPRYVALGWTETGAGFLLTVFLLAQPIGMGLFTLFGDRFDDRRLWIVGMGAIAAIGTIGIAITPLSSPWFFVILFGTGSGGLFAIALTLPIDLAPDGQATDRLATMAMGIGYILSAFGPSLIGSARDLTGSYVPAFVAMCVVSLILGLIGTAFNPAYEGTIA
ncbi:MFS transporter [Natrarchaeobius halalkaliphilus]|uniref:MFS transporter n=1 Tax=Natrarchaeobius halalkaliphilus TaxID=1679091 RepID=A0A3N6LXJ6_9EURY|nr:MFS transporter [Natrarchaeobius halalkaliphilus]RQG86791.1 MFS transporter [Natrarchaeobius halalkaliphilus]